MKSFKVFREEHLEEKNVPTSPEKWARAKSAAKSKFAVYPSAYANGWASKKYKAMGGGWKSTSEDVELEEGSYMDTVKKRIAGRNAEKYSQYSKADKEQDRPVSSKLYAKMAKNQKKLSEDGMGVGAMSAAPTNTVGSGKIAGSGGQGGEPGVNPKKKKGPVLITMSRRKPPVG